MIRGTTPTRTFELPFEASALSCVHVVFTQDGKEVLKKKTEDCTFDGNMICCKLTQEETNLFHCDSLFSVQLHCLTYEGNALVSNRHWEPVMPCDDSDVIV